MIVQVPPAITVAVAPATVQTPGVADEKLTARPELAVAVSATDWFGTNGETSAGSVKVIVWLAGVIVKLWLTCGAGL